ncbi:SpoIIE family protein phosphatase [Streptomyces tricolor]|uniref:SpoIIE family protein phosphatase n=1 Tax=Streptomyces tricolor TaxID=68277 RepID=UPI003D75167B
MECRRGRRGPAPPRPHYRRPQHHHSATSRSPGTCRPSFSTRAADASCSTCPPAPPWAAAAPFRHHLHRLPTGRPAHLYTDGLIETRDLPIDIRLHALLDILDKPDRPLDATCDLLLRTLRAGGDLDDVALLIARAQVSR